MIRLQRSQALERIIRQDDVADLAIPTFTLVRQAIEEGRTDEALDCLEYAYHETMTTIDSRTATLDMAVTRIASLGEEELEKFWRQKFVPKAADFLSSTPGVEESLQRVAEMYRSLLSNFTITEEADKYVIQLDPCGAGGRLRRSKSIATTKKAHPWAWGRSGVSLYCTHCCIMWEMIPIELRGYPVKICLYNENPEAPCVQIFYKKPQLIPEEYFKNIGKPVPDK